ncbi:MAG: RidA family protein [Gemmatimonadaceae bacterium]|nr:RidA family protein [Gemmatimonadaceae bacterium]
MFRLSIHVVPVLLTLAAAPALAQGARQPVIPAGQSASPTLTPGIRVGNMVFASGQLGLRRDAPDSTIQGQTKVALENTQKVFEAAGTTMANAVKCTVFLIDLKDFAGMNAAYREFFPTSPPARSTVVVAALVSAGAKVEIECSAAIP